MATESLYPKIEIPETDIWGLLFERNTEFPSDQVIYVNPVTASYYTYLDVKTIAISFGNALRSNWNWQPGDVLAVFSPNCIDTPALTWGTLWAGGVVSPANPDYSVSEFAFQLKDSGAKAILTQASSLKTVLEAAKQAGISQARIVLMGDDKDGRAEHSMDFMARGEEGLGERSFLQAVLHCLHCLLLGDNRVAQRFAAGQCNLNWKSDTILGVLPFFHSYGLTMLIHHPIYSGLQTVVLSRFSLDTFCKVIQDYKITFGYVVPPILLALSKSPSVANYDLSSIRMLTSAAAPLTRELVEAVYERLKIKVNQAYGLSETSPATHLQRWEDWHKTIGSVGRLLPNQVAKYISASGDSLPPGSVGELWIKGPNIFPGYLNNAEATANTLTSDGYLKTGDIGFQDPAGNFYITDRAKELIKYKGFQVAPAELEGLLVGHNKVVDACVVGVYDAQQATEVPMAFIVRANTSQDGVSLGKEIMSWVESKVAKHKWLRGGVKFVDGIPRTSSGKILRRLVREQAIKDTKGSESLKSKL